MDFEEFKEQFAEDVKNDLEGKGIDASVKVNTVEKMNENYDALTVTPEGSNVGVNLNMNKFFEAYDSGDVDYDQVVDKAVMVIREGFENKPEIDVNALTDYEQMKDKLVMEVVSAETNADMLTKVPHHDIEDMAVVYRFVLDSNDDGHATILVTNQLFDSMGVTPEQLHADAMENSPELKPAVIKGMTEVMAEMMGVDVEDLAGMGMEKAGADETPDEAERKGLGTPATRAGIIEKLVNISFIERKGDRKTKYLVPTHKGEALITVVPEAIQSASMTAEWEQKLLEVERQSYSSEQFIDEIEELIRNLIDTYEVIPNAEVLRHPAYEPIGKCPHCGKDVIEKSKGFFCSDKDCKFALWKDNRFFDSLSKKLTKQIAEQLLKNGKSNLKKCRSVRTGKTYDCKVTILVGDDGQVKYNLAFDD